GKDFNPSVAELVVFGGERILIDANLADGRLRRQLAGGESVNVHLPAIRSGRWPGESFQVGLQFVRVVRQGFEGFAGNHDGTGIVAGVHINSRRSFGDLNFLLGNFDHHGYIQAQGLVSYVNVGVFIQSESLRDDVERVFSRWKVLELVHSLAVGLY